MRSLDLTYSALTKSVTKGFRINEINEMKTVFMYRFINVGK